MLDWLWRTIVWLRDFSVELLATWTKTMSLVLSWFSARPTSVLVMFGVGVYLAILVIGTIAIHKKSEYEGLDDTLREKQLWQFRLMSPLLWIISILIIALYAILLGGIVSLLGLVLSRFFTLLQTLPLWKQIVSISPFLLLASGTLLKSFIDLSDKVENQKSMLRHTLVQYLKGQRRFDQETVEHYFISVEKGCDPPLNRRGRTTSWEFELPLIGKLSIDRLARYGLKFWYPYLRMGGFIFTLFLFVMLFMNTPQLQSWDKLSLSAIFSGKIFTKEGQAIFSIIAIFSAGIFWFDPFFVLKSRFLAVYMEIYSPDNTQFYSEEEIEELGGHNEETYYVTIVAERDPKLGLFLKDLQLDPHLTKLPPRLVEKFEARESEESLIQCALATGAAYFAEGFLITHFIPQLVSAAFLVSLLFIPWGIFHISAFFENPARTIFFVGMILYTALRNVFTPRREQSWVTRYKEEDQRRKNEQSSMEKPLDDFDSVVDMQSEELEQDSMVSPKEEEKLPTVVLVQIVGFLISGAVLLLSLYFTRKGYLIIPEQYYLHYIGVPVFFVGMTLLFFSSAQEERVELGLEKNKNFPTEGPHMRIRYPRSSAIIIALIGYSFVFQSIAGVTGAGLIFVLFSWGATFLDKRNAERYGEEWRKYSERTNRLIPYVF